MRTLFEFLRSKTAKVWKPRFLKKTTDTKGFVLRMYMKGRPSESQPRENEIEYLPYKEATSRNQLSIST